jgi:PAS domain S-box-containing protein
MAVSPATAPDALALLHELQVHQVELQLQDEELRRCETELETSLARKLQRYDAAPVGFFTLDRDTTMTQLNRTGAALPGVARESLRGERFDTFLTEGSTAALRAMRQRLASGTASESHELEIQPQDGAGRRAFATLATDSHGSGVLLALALTGRT